MCRKLYTDQYVWEYNREARVNSSKLKSQDSTTAPQFFVVIGLTFIKKLDKGCPCKVRASFSIETQIKYVSQYVTFSLRSIIYEAC